MLFVNLSFCLLSGGDPAIATTRFSTETSILSIKDNKGTTLGCASVRYWLSWGRGHGYKTVTKFVISLSKSHCTLLPCRKRQLNTVSSFTDSSSADIKKKCYIQYSSE